MKESMARGLALSWLIRSECVKEVGEGDSCPLSNSLCDILNLYLALNWMKSLGWVGCQTEKAVSSKRNSQVFQFPKSTEE